MEYEKYKRPDNGKPMTDQELNAVIKAPRPIIGNGAHKSNVTMYQCYITHKFWRGMDKKRMLFLCGEIIRKEAAYLNVGELAKVRALMDELKASIEA